MAGDLCPYCGTLLTTSLKFCVNCRRSVTEDKIRQAGYAGRSTEDQIELEEGQGKFKLSRKTSYDGVRTVRTVFTTLSTLLAICFVYYFTMKFVIHQPIPFEEQITGVVNKVQDGVQNNIPQQQSGGGQSYSQQEPSQPAH
jgi:hypothetical protein